MTSRNHKKEGKMEYKTLTKYAGVAATLCMGTAFAGDGSNEPGFVPVPHEMKLPSAPPRSVSSAETYIMGGCCNPMARTEAKLPPTPPTLISKLTE